MIYVPVGLFALAAVLGLTILLKIIRNRATYKPLVFLHGSFAVIALVILILNFMSNPKGLYLIVGLFWLTAVMGLSTFAYDITKREPPKIVALLHAGAAITSFALLVLYVFYW